MRGLMTAALVIFSGDVGPNLVDAQGAPRADGGYFRLVVTDTAGLYTNGSLTATGTSPPQPVGGYAYMIGADSDIGGLQNEAVYVSRSNAPGLPHFIFDDSEGPRLIIERDGTLVWIDDDGVYPMEFGPEDSCGDGYRCLMVPN